MVATHSVAKVINLVFPAARLFSGYKIGFPVKQFTFYPVIPAGTSLDMPNVKKSLKQICPQIEFSETDDLRSAVLASLAEKIVKGVTADKIGPENLNPKELTRIKQKLNVFLGVDLKVAPEKTLEETIRETQRALVDSPLGKNNLAVVVETKRGFQLHLEEADHDLDVIQTKYKYLLKNYAGLFIRRDIEGYYRQRLKTSTIVEKLILSLIGLNFAVYFALKKTGLLEANFIQYFAPTKIAIFTLLGLAENYQKAVRENWDQAHRASQEILKLLATP